MLNKQLACLFCTFLLLFTSNAFGVVDASKSYQAGIEAIESGSYSKAFNLLKQALDAGLYGERLTQAYLKIYYVSIILNDKQNIQFYEDQCKKKSSDFSPLPNSPFILEIYLIDDKHDVVKVIRSGNIPEGSKILFEFQRTSSYIRKMPYLVKKDSFDFSKLISDVKIQMANRFTEKCLLLRLNETGTKMWNKITKENINKRCLLVLNNEVLVAPYIREEIKGGKIFFRPNEANDIHGLLALIKLNSRGNN